MVPITSDLLVEGVVWAAARQRVVAVGQAVLADWRAVEADCPAGLLVAVAELLLEEQLVPRAQVVWPAFLVRVVRPLVAAWPVALLAVTAARCAVQTIANHRNQRGWRQSQSE